MRTAIIGALVVAGCGSPAPPPAVPPAPTLPTSRAEPRRDQSPPVETTAEQLWRDYQHDEPSAAEKFGGRVVAVEGLVVSVVPTGIGTEVRLRGAQEIRSAEVVARYAALVSGAPRLGERVRIVGVCTGRRPGTTVVGVDHSLLPAHGFGDPSQLTTCEAEFRTDFDFDLFHEYERMLIDLAI